MPDPDEDRLLAESSKFVALQVCAVPLDAEGSRFGLFTSYGQHRTYRGAYTREEMCNFLRDDFLHWFKNEERRRQREEQVRRPVKIAADAIELDLNLDNL